MIHHYWCKVKAKSYNKCRKKELPSAEKAEGRISFTSEIQVMHKWNTNLAHAKCTRFCVLLAFIQHEERISWAFSHFFEKTAVLVIVEFKCHFEGIFLSGRLLTVKYSTTLEGVIFVRIIGVRSLAAMPPIVGIRFGVPCVNVAGVGEHHADTAEAPPLRRLRNVLGCVESPVLALNTNVSGDALAVSVGRESPRIFRTAIAAVYVDRLRQAHGSALGVRRAYSRFCW